MDQTDLLSQARQGDIDAFHTLFSAFQPQLKSFLYRIVADREDVEDLAQDVFLLAFEKLASFRGEASLKTWAFTIAANQAKKHLKNRQRWATDTFERTRDYAYQVPSAMKLIDDASSLSPQGVYEIREHIDYCFTCVSKMLVLEQQIAVILKEVYGFKVREIAVILDLSESVVKHRLHDARQTMVAIFDDTCALVSKRGVCNQCSELNGRFNPKQNRREELMKIKLVRERPKRSRAELFDLRVALVKTIDPLDGNGADLHEAFMKINHRVNAFPE